MDVGKDEEFMVSTQGAGGQGKLDVKIISPSRRPIPCKLESGTANELHTVKYIPPEEGPYRVDISYDGNPLPGSPFAVEGVMPPDPSKVGPFHLVFRLIQTFRKIVSQLCVNRTVLADKSPSVDLFLLGLSCDTD